MPNTINPTILRKYYETRFGTLCPLSYSTIHRLWTTTRTTTHTGRNVSQRDLFDRAERTIQLMRNLHPNPPLGS